MIEEKAEFHVLTAKEKKMAECMRCNAKLFFLFFFHHTAIMPTCSRRVEEPLAFKTNPYRSRKAEKTHSGTLITHTVHSTECNHCLITTPSLPELEPSAVYCFCPSLCTCLGNIASQVSFSSPPSFSPSLLLSHSLWR